MTEQIKTWYELRKFISTLEGGQLGQPVKVIVDGKEVDINAISIENDKTILHASSKETNNY